MVLKNIICMRYLSDKFLLFLFSNNNVNVGFTFEKKLVYISAHLLKIY